MSGIRTNRTNGTSGLHIRVPNRFLIWGGHGWIAGLLKDLLHHQGKEVYTTTIRMEDRDDVAKALEVLKPTHVLDAAGCIGRPNVDWCEDNKAQTVRSNVVGTLTLADECDKRGIHCTVFATGYIYQYDEEHPIGGPGFKETDAPNFDGSFYSMTKAHVEPILASFKNVLILRLRMPVSDDLNHRNFVTKISECRGYDFTNPGAISHNEVLGLFKEIVRPGFTWKNFSIEDQARVIKAGRSNCQLDTAMLVKKMMGYGHEIPEVHEAYRQCFERMKAAGIQWLLILVNSLIFLQSVCQRPSLDRS
ncbi:dTDP-glucose 4,6-dehydratase [Fusarium oxysporum]|nr:dTDP-glucose 4,6-dehydratase [Fusarium oxysporum]